MFSRSSFGSFSFALRLGKGYGSFQPIALNAALLDAGIGDVNLIEMGDVLPPNCKEAIFSSLSTGLFVPVSSISITRNRIDGVTPHGFLSPIIGVAIAVGIPEDLSLPGVIGKHCDEGYADDCEERAREIVEQGMEERKRPIKEIKSVSIQMDDIKSWGSVFAAIVLFK
jgi:arginine decarboxylase